jgi:hypothetical protein
MLDRIALLNGMQCRSLDSRLNIRVTVWAISQKLIRWMIITFIWHDRIIDLVQMLLQYILFQPHPPSIV